jgi:hypothetical protein
MTTARRVGKIVSSWFKNKKAGPKFVGPADFSLDIK